jgi:hypothetical protein
LRVDSAEVSSLGLLVEGSMVAKPPGCVGGRGGRDPVRGGGRGVKLRDAGEVEIQDSRGRGLQIRSRGSASHRVLRDLEPWARWVLRRTTSLLSPGCIRRTARRNSCAGADKHDGVRGVKAPPVGRGRLVPAGDRAGNEIVIVASQAFYPGGTAEGRQYAGDQWRLREFERFTTGRIISRRGGRAHHLDALAPVASIHYRKCECHNPYE